MDAIAKEETQPKELLLGVGFGVARFAIGLVSIVVAVGVPAGLVYGAIRLVKFVWVQP